MMDDLPFKPEDITVPKYDDMTIKELFAALEAHDAHHAEHHKREKELNDLLQSAVAIAKRNGDGTHWQRFVNRCTELGIHGITAKTFRLLQIDTEAGDDGKYRETQTTEKG